MLYVLFMCKRVLPPGVSPIAVDKYINNNININLTGPGSFSVAGFGISNAGHQGSATREYAVNSAKHYHSFQMHLIS
jgi:hypothetical protein